MSDRRAPTTDRDDRTAHDRRRDLAFIAVVGLVAITVDVVNAFSTAHDRAEAGRPTPLWEPLVWEATSGLVILLLTPALMAFTRRVTPFVAPWIRVVPLHLLAAVAFSVTHVAAMGVLRWGVYGAAGGFYAPFQPLGEFPYEFRKDALAYLALVVTYVGWRRLSPPRPAARDLPSIEVRDGARRRFVPLADVAWVEAAGNYVELHRGGAPILHRATLADLERQLQGAGFVRIHRSRLVRQGAVAEVRSKPSGDYLVRLADGRELTGSRRYRKPLLDG